MKLEAIVAGLEDLPLGSRGRCGWSGEGTSAIRRMVIGKKLLRRRRS